MANTNTKPADINSWENVNIGNKTYTKAYANDVANQEEMRQAIVNGNNQVSVSDKVGNTWDNVSGKQTSVQPIQPKIQPNFGYLDDANKARQAIIQGRLAESLGSQDGLIRDAEGSLVKKTEQINGDVYDAQETQRASGVQRGVQYSQQQQAVENGVSRAGIKMIVDAGKDRDTAIMNIKDRIASLKSGASYEMQASQSQADSEKGKAMNDYNMRQEERQWQLDDVQASYDRQDTVTADTRNYESKLLEDNKAYADKLLKEGYTREDAVRVLEMGDKVKLMDIDNKYKVDFLALDTQAQLKVMGVKNVHELKMQGNEITAQKIITGMNNASSEKQTGMQVSASIQNNNNDNATSRANNSANIAQSNKENQDRIIASGLDSQAKASALRNEFMNNVLMKDPTFNPYGTDAKSISQLKQYAELNGVTVADMNVLLGKDKAKADAIAKKITNSGKTPIKVPTTRSDNETYVR